MGRRRTATTTTTTTTDPTTAVAYLRVSTAEQADSGLGLAAQRATVTADVQRRGLRLVEVFTDEGISGKSTENRPGLAAALDAVATGRAGVLLVAKLDRLSRSVADAAGLLDQAQRGGWALIAADLGVDTTTPAGEAMANVMATFAQLERKLIGQRTRAGPGHQTRPGPVPRATLHLAGRRGGPDRHRAPGRRLLVGPSPAGSKPTPCPPPKAEHGGTRRRSARSPSARTPQPWPADSPPVAALWRVGDLETGPPRAPGGVP